MRKIRAIMSFIRGIIFDFLLLFFIYLPGSSGIILRRWYYSKRFKKCGKNLMVMPGVHIHGEHNISVGDDVMIRENVIMSAGVGNPNTEKREIRTVGRYDNNKQMGFIEIGSYTSIGHGAFILGYGGLKIGEKCGIGPGAKILSETFHHKGTHSERIYKYSRGAMPEELCVLRGFIEFKDGAGVASNVVVLPGATIGQDSWVSPNSVVRLGGRIDDHVIAKGDPAVTVLKRSYHLNYEI